MKIVSNVRRHLSSSTEEEMNAMEKRKMNSSSPQSTYSHSSSRVSEHRNDDNDVNFLDGTVDERDTNSPTLSFETAATDEKVGGCGLFIHQVSNRFDTDKSDRSTVISDMVDNIEEEIHERFFARSQSDSSVDTDNDTMNEDTQDTFEEEDDEQDVTIDSNMPSVTSTPVSSKTSTIRQSKSLDTDNTTESEKKEQSIKVKEEGQDTFVSVEEVEESQAKNGSWFGGFFSSNAIVNVDESAKENEEEEEPVEEAAKPIQNDEQRSASKDILSRVKEVSALVAEVFNLPLSIIDEEKSTTDQDEEKMSTVQEEEPAAVPVAVDIFAVESSSTVDSIELSVFRQTDIPTMANGTKENKARLSEVPETKLLDPDDDVAAEKKVSQKKRWRKIPKKVRSISRKLFAKAA